MIEFLLCDYQPFYHHTFIECHKQQNLYNIVPHPVYKRLYLFFQNPQMCFCYKSTIGQIKSISEVFSQLHIDKLRPPLPLS